MRAVAADPASLLKATAKFLNVNVLPTDVDLRASADFIRAVPIAFARKYLMLGLIDHPGDDEQTMRVALGDAAHWDKLDTLSRLLRKKIEPVLTTDEVLLRAINKAYEDRSGETEQLIDRLEGTDVLTEVQNLKPREDLLDTGDRAPVIKLVNMLLFDAVKGRASDVHIQPYEQRLLCRMRIDGVLFDAFEIPQHLQEEVISRVKVLGGMNIAEKRLPQDGRATVDVGNRVVDLRIASMPTAYGERVVIRLLDKSARLYTLEELGMDPETLVRFRELIHVEHGLILVTGPTGSGKSTTLYGALTELDTTQRNAVTLEDPIEYQLDGISQTQINTKKGMTFASGLRSILRQDPDIIMLGEIRDQETAVMAIQAALTGHLVFSTLHTNDAASAVTRLLDLGIEPYLLSSSLIGVLAQRLVRRNCSACITPAALSEPEVNEWSLSHASLTDVAQGAGCSDCRDTGYQGRLGVFELLAATEQIRQLIQSGANASEIGRAAINDGMKPMRTDGIGKVLSGSTTLDEVERVTVRAV
jgi:general secretion pathway protein E